MAKLKIESAGEYKFEGVVDGFNVRAEASLMEYGGFNISIYVNDSLVWGDGYKENRLKDIKSTFDSDIEYCIYEYKKDRGL